MKLYAKQVPPEHQESPLYMFGEWPENVVIHGNIHYNDHTTPEYRDIVKYFDEMAYYWRAGCYSTISEALQDYGFTRNDGKGWNNKQKHEWKQLMESDDTTDDDALVCHVLELITGIKFDFSTISGCCQGDWQDIIYPAEYGRDWLEAFETEYFNTGTEWIIDPDGDACSMYAHGWNDELIRAEIADAAGCNPGDVVLLKFSGWARSASYEEVSA